MTFVYPEIEAIIDTDNGCYNTLVIENQGLLTRIVTDLSSQLEGLNGSARIFAGDIATPPAKIAALIDRFIPFEITRKPLLTAVTRALEQEAVSAEFYERTSALLGTIETLFDDLAFNMPCDVVFSNISVAGLLKACAPELRTDAVTISEKLLDYMELVREFDRPRLFFTLNMRAFVPDSEMSLFVSTALTHGYHLIGLESREYPKLENERRVIIDSDLCEIY